MNKIHINIVLIADRVNNHDDATITSKTLEMVEDEYFNDIYNTLSSLTTKKIYHYMNPKIFLENIHKHKNDIVLSIWSGVSSRNRKALIPSICEAYNIKYVGADTYTQIICQDKEMSKQICKKYGIKTANYQLIKDKDNLNLLNFLKYPIVIKPNFEGGSIGISQKNLVYNFNDAEKMTLFLLETFNQPILAEEFIDGEEISILIIDKKQKIDMIEATVLYDTTNTLNLTKILYDFELKKNTTIISEKIITNELNKEILVNAINLFNSLDKVDIMRIDGRLHNNDFYCIELSPDAYLGKDTTFALAYQHNNKTYSDMLFTLLNNSIESD